MEVNMEKKALYVCGIGACPEVALYTCGLAGCPSVKRVEGVVVIEHPGEPEKGRVEMTPAEWNALLESAKPA